MIETIAIDARSILFKQRGMPVYVYMLCKLIPVILKNIHFYVLINKACEYNEAPDNYAKRLSELAKLSNIELVNIDADSDFSWEQVALRKWLHNIKPNLLHMPANRVCLFSPVPQISTFHDIMEWKFLKKIYEIPKDSTFKFKLYTLKVRFYVWLIYMLGLRKVDRVLSISAYAENSIIKQFPFTKHKIRYVHHGVPEGYKCDSNFSGLDKRSGILMLGGDSHQKNPENAIKAWNLLPVELKEQHPLIIAGFTGNSSSLIMKVINDLSLTTKVIIKDWLSNQELVQLFQRSAALIFVSREEGFGFPMLQAMTCGTPVITSKAQVLIEIGQNACLTSDAENHHAIAKNLSLVLSTPEVWLELHNNGLARAKDFSWYSACSKIANEYREVMRTNEKR